MKRLGIGIQFDAKVVPARISRVATATHPFGLNRHNQLFDWLAQHPTPSWAKVPLDILNRSSWPTGNEDDDDDIVNGRIESTAISWSARWAVCGCHETRLSSSHKMEAHPSFLFDRVLISFFFLSLSPSSSSSSSYLMSYSLIIIQSSLSVLCDAFSDSFFLFIFFSASMK